MTITLRALGLSAFMMGAASVASAAECIAPANPGGGWDFTCRQIGKILHDIGQVDKPVQVTNMAGGGGGLAFAHVVNERADDADLIVAIDHDISAVSSEGLHQVVGKRVVVVDQQHAYIAKLFVVHL